MSPHGPYRILIPGHNDGICHGSIDDATLDIRLLHLESTLNVRDHLRCHTHTISLEDAKQIPYAAISYDWGDPEPSYSVFLNGQNLQVSRFLERFLRNLSGNVAKNLPHLWIDALCIDKSNPAEKAKHIRHMQRIYSNSVAVLVGIDLYPDGPDLAQMVHDLCAVSPEKQPLFDLEQIPYSGQEAYRLLHTWARATDYSARGPLTGVGDLVKALSDQKKYMVDVSSHLTSSNEKIGRSRRRESPLELRRKLCGKIEDTQHRRFFIAICRNATDLDWLLQRCSRPDDEPVSCSKVLKTISSTLNEYVKVESDIKERRKYLESLPSPFMVTTSLEYDVWASLKIVEVGLAAGMLAKWLERFPTNTKDSKYTTFREHTMADLSNIRLAISFIDEMENVDHNEIRCHLEDCAAWWLLQVESAAVLHFTSMSYRSKSWSPEQPNSSPLSEASPYVSKVNGPKNHHIDPKCSFIDALLPNDPMRRHYAFRAACWVTSAFRPLTILELFTAATTRVLSDDPEWPWSTGSAQLQAKDLMTACNQFLELDAKGLVRFRNAKFVDLLARQVPGYIEDAQYFSAMVCLTHISIMDVQLLLEPWKDFIALRERFALHDYVVTFWQYHCRLVESHAAELPGQLQMLFDAAWIAARRVHLATKLRGVFTGPNINGIGSCLDSVQAGLGFSRSHKFDNLSRIYYRMGAQTMPEDNCQPASQPTQEEYSQSPQKVLGTSTTVRSEQTEPYSTGDWYLVNHGDYNSTSRD